MKNALLGLVVGITLGLIIARFPRPHGGNHHVLIAYPEGWQDGEHRPCFLGPENSGTVDRVTVRSIPLPQLDCDRYVQGELIHRTPPERIFALDVDFIGDFRGSLEPRRETPWTCERIGEKIECKP